MAIQSYAYGSYIANNIFFKNTGAGIAFNTVTDSLIGLILINNIFRSNSTYGVSVLNNVGIALFDYNCFSNNTSGNYNKGALPGTHDVLSDPLFTSEVSGFEDFTLQSGSPCINTGFGYNGV
jgi:hypothetical protein